MNFFGIGPMELLIVLVVALLVLGPAKMADTAKSLGKAVRDLQRAASEVPRALSLDDEPKTAPAPERRQVSSKPAEDQGDKPVPRA
ncbi:MAG: twin-arginine translocase TatA/TatE family subunit [Chloroflexi bacterium]|nr:twin-arginine translocase TatA/TatE family subunit [Chloroflexota bacterium]